jgi:hypothetical protein
MTDDVRDIGAELTIAVDAVPADMDEVHRILKVAVWARLDTANCLRICAILKRLPDGRDLVTAWLHHATAAARDWRHQYWIVAFAINNLTSRELAETFYHARPWLASLGLDLDHEYKNDTNFPAALVLMSPEGVCDNDLQSGAITHKWGLDELLNTPPMNSALSPHVTVFLRPGTYRGRMFCGPRTLRIIALQGRRRTNIDLGPGESIMVRSHQLELDGLTIRSSGAAGSTAPAIDCRGLAVLNLHDCEVIVQNGAAIELGSGQGASARISRCRIAGAICCRELTRASVKVRDTCFDASPGPAAVRGSDSTLIMERCCFMPGAGADLAGTETAWENVQLRDLLFVVKDQDERSMIASGLALQANAGGGPEGSIERIQYVTADELTRHLEGEVTVAAATLASDLVAKGVL